MHRHTHMHAHPHSSYSLGFTRLFYFFTWTLRSPDPPSSVNHKTMVTFTKKTKQTILKSLTTKSDQGKFWHQIDPESQKSQLIVMAIMDRLFWEVYDMTSARQADRETHIKCSSPFWGRTEGWGAPPAHQLTSTMWSQHTGRSACIPSSVRRLDSTI